MACVALSCDEESPGPTAGDDPIPPPVPIIPTPIEWKWQNPLPQGNELTAASAAPDGHVFAVGYGGTVMEWDGSDWQSHDTATDQVLWGVWAETSDKVYVAAQGGAVWTIADGGWFRYETGAYAMNDIHGAGGRVFAVGTEGTLISLGESGWRRRNIDTTVELTSVWVSPTGRAYVTMANGSIGTWNGSEFVSEPLSPGAYLTSIWGNTDGDIYAVGAGPTFAHFNGSIWNLLPTPSLGDLYDVWMLTASELFVVGVGGTAHWSGGQWEVEPSGGIIMRAITGSPNGVMAVGQGGRLLEKTPTGWLRHDRGSNRTITGLYASSSTEAVACTGDGRIIRVTTSGNIDTTTVASHLEFWDIDGNSPTDIYAVGRYAPTGRWSGAIYHFDGLSWSLVASSGFMVSSVSAVGEDNVWATDFDGPVLHLDDSGWDDDSTATSPHLIYDMWAASDGSLYFAGCQLSINGIRRGYIKYTFNGDWIEEFFPDVTHFRAVWGRSPNEVYVVGDGGKARVFEGAGWVPMPSVPHNPFTFAIGGPASGVVLFGGSGLFRFDGGSFTAIRTGMGVGVSSIDFLSDGTGWIAGGSGILRCEGCAFAP